jgi:hypothetical protein
VARVAAVEDAVDEVAVDLSEHDVRLQRLSEELAQGVAVIPDTRKLMRKILDETARATTGRES